MIRKWFRRKPLNVLEGGTGANTFEKACENLGAVKKTGDIITGNLEFYGENNEGESFLHPVVNAKVGDNGIDVVVGGSDNKSSLTIGSGSWANDDSAPSGAGDLNLTANDSIRLFQKRTKTVNQETKDYLAERWRFNTSGYLQHLNAYDQADYYPFQCRRTYNVTDNTTGEIQQKDAIAGGLRLNSSIGQSNTSYIQGKDNTLFGMQAYCKSNTNVSNVLLLGAKVEQVNNQNVNRRIVSFRTGLDNGTYDSVGKATADAWRAALISDKGYGMSGNDDAVSKEWAKWIGTPSWTVINNVHQGTKAYAEASANTPDTRVIGKYEIPETAKEILIYAREHVTPPGTNKYRYNSTLVIPSVVFNHIDENGRVFMLGGGWNQLFTGDAAKFKLSKEDGKYVLRVLGMSVNNTWIGSRWFIYSR